MSAYWFRALPPIALLFLIVMPVSSRAQSCVTGQTCDTKTCINSQCAPARPDGAACDVFQQCSSKNCVSNVCRSRGAGACSTNNQCASGNCASGACAPAKDIGAACGFPQECASKYCLNRTCAVPKGNGQWCINSNECGSGNCLDHFCRATSGSSSPVASKPPLPSIYHDVFVNELLTSDRLPALRSELFDALRKTIPCATTRAVIQKFSQMAVNWQNPLEFAITAGNYCAVDEIAKRVPGKPLAGKDSSTYSYLSSGGSLDTVIAGNTVEIEAMRVFIANLLKLGMEKDTILAGAAMRCPSRNAQEAVLEMVLTYGAKTSVAMPEQARLGQSTVDSVVYEKCPEASELLWKLKTRPRSPVNAASRPSYPGMANLPPIVRLPPLPASAASAVTGRTK